MRILLIGCMAGMALLAAFYLRRREMSTGVYLAWGLLALLVPLLGPFLVILNHPGRLRQEYRRGRVRHFSAWTLMAVAGRRGRTTSIRHLLSANYYRFEEKVNSFLERIR